MNLIELIGYKQSPAYRQIATTFSKSTDTDFASADRKSTFAIFNKFMAVNGFTLLGKEGSFGAVYEKPGYPWVFKVFTKDAAYLWYLNYCIQHQSNQNIPKIKGKMIRINSNTFAVRMEKLQHYTHNNSTVDKLISMLHDIDYINQLYEDELEWIKAEFPGVYQIFCDIRHQTSYPLDMHSLNYMMRGRTVVITDPVYDEAADKGYMLAELIGYRNHPIYTAAKDIFQSKPTWSPSSRKLRNFTNKLVNLGYNIDVKGSGRAGIVFKRPNDQYVIKIFHDDPEYMMYIRYTMHNQDNPHVPKTRGKLMKINDNTYAIRIEELRPIVAKDRHDKDLINSITNTMIWGRFKQNTYIRSESPGLYKLLVDLANLYGDNNGTDLIDSNIMQRADGTIVVTDPA